MISLSAERVINISKLFTFMATEWEQPDTDLDNVIGEADVRYFMSDSSNIQDMESAVLENPDDTSMWIKLAYKKLADTQR